MVEMTPIKVGETIIRNFAHPNWIKQFAKKKKPKKKGGGY